MKSAIKQSPQEQGRPQLQHKGDLKHKGESGILIGQQKGVADHKGAHKGIKGGDPRAGIK